jgi:hypothetical protein
MHMGKGRRCGATDRKEPGSTLQVSVTIPAVSTGDSTGESSDSGSVAHLAFLVGFSLVNDTWGRSIVHLNWG